MSYNITKFFLVLLVAVIFCYSFTGCINNEVKDSKQVSQSDNDNEIVVLGDEDSKNSFDLKVVDDKDVVYRYKVYSDENSVGNALYSLRFIDDPSFFSYVNGIRADYSKDKAYWAVFLEDEYSNVGIDEILLPLEQEDLEIRYIKN